MQTFTEGKHPTEGVLSEAAGQRSRDAIVILAGSGIIAPMTVLGQLTSGANAGKYSPSPAVAEAPDVGNQVANAICLYGADATAADVAVAALTRDTEVIVSRLTYHDSVNDQPKRDAKLAQLRAVGIIAR